MLKEKKRAAEERAKRQSERAAQKACARQRAREKEKEEQAARDNQKLMQKKQEYLILEHSIFCQCSNLKVPWRGGHNVGRGARASVLV